MVTIYPVPGHYLAGVPQVPLAVDAKTAERLVRTGAFTTDGSGDGQEPGPLEQLDFYDPPLAHGEHYAVKE
jgi:hypothetical protein